MWNLYSSFETSLSISLGIINSRIGMSKDEMVNKVFDCIIDEMGTLISHNG
jgi:hypothetical protein